MNTNKLLTADKKLNSCKPTPKIHLFPLTMDLSEEQEKINTPTIVEGLQSTLRFAPACLLHFPWMNSLHSL